MKLITEKYNLIMIIKQKRMTLTTDFNQIFNYMN